MNKYNIRETENFNETNYNGIEKLIHVIWKGENPPDYYHNEVLTWASISQCDWTIYGWRDSDLAWLKETADDYGKKVFEVAESMKEFAAYVDVIRLYIVYRFGGYYFDADFEVYREISDLSRINADIIFCNSTDHYYTSISYCFFAAMRNLPFLKNFLEELIRKYENNEMEDWIIKRTGPIFLGCRYVIYDGEINPVMLPMYYFYANRIGDYYITTDEDGSMVIKRNEKDYTDIAFGRHMFSSNGEYKNFE